jgi:TonB family protein
VSIKGTTMLKTLPRILLIFGSAQLCVATLGLGAAAALAPAQTPQPSPAIQQVAPEAQLAKPQVLTQEEALKQLLLGKALYLRGGYQDNALSFNEYGKLSSHSAQGSYTLSAIQINKVRLTKHKVQLEGIRYGLHFVGQLPYEDTAKAMDRVRITPKKKVVKITIDREMVVKPKKVKAEKKAQAVRPALAQTTQAPAPQVALPVEKSEADQTTASPQTQLAAPQVPEEKSPAEQLKASIAATPEAERPADAASVTTTTSPEHAARVLTEALDQIFAPSLDKRMLDAMPDFWKLYYQAVEAKTDYRPKDPSILRQNTVDRKARLASTFEPASNEYAQANGVAGMALYHTVIGPDGKVGEIAVGRPIGFGLDENAVESIRKASFEPALKDGKPVSVLLDLAVQFRIFSKRTAVVNPVEPAEKSAPSVLPGPYSVPRP